ncbi:hypothetical protein Scep_007401 [Stephania cephalantha]|uniref:Uncharacterized protein n=1 Tax=Stephania cephalantha TaxID=152367 RepID=A0AAP0PN78_9MAGN
MPLGAQRPWEALPRMFRPVAVVMGVALLPHLPSPFTSWASNGGPILGQTPPPSFGGSGGGVAIPFRMHRCGTTF